MKTYTRLVPFVLILQSALALPVYADIPVSPEIAAKAVSCPMLFKTEAEQNEIIATALADVKSTQSRYRKIVASVFSSKIQKRVLKTCAAKDCSKEDIVRAVVSETAEVLKSAHKYQGYAIMASLMISGVYVSKMVSHYSGGDPMIAFLIGQQVNRFMNAFQRPFDLILDPKLQKWVSKTTGDGIENSIKEENAGFKSAYQKGQEAYTLLEQAGKGIPLGYQNDIQNHVLSIQNYLGLNVASSEVKSSDDDLARMLASLMFESRIFHAEMPPTNPQLLALVGPSVRPLSPLVERLKDKIWSALDAEELREAKDAGRKEYDRAGAQKYYDSLIDAWFKPNTQPLEPRQNLSG